MIVDGKKIAEEIVRSLKVDVLRMDVPPRLTVFTCAPNAATQQFLNLKSKRAVEVGVIVDIKECAEDTTTEEIATLIDSMVSSTDGIILQLPFPDTVDADALISRIPRSHDVDVIGAWSEEACVADAPVLPPVVAAIREIAERYHVEVTGKRALVVGSGRLVGAPSAVWLKTRGAEVTIADRNTSDLAELAQRADLIILGAGSPGILTPDMIETTTAIFDAGTSESEGRLVGDADPRCAEKAALYTPVPGGIGPITIAVLLRNLVLLMQDRKIR